MNVDPVAAFVAAINAADLAALAALMPDDHRFVDSMGSEIVGREKMLAGWRGYFQMFPGYRITVEQRLEAGDRVGLFGRTVATHAASGREVKMRAAWLALVRDGLIAEWRVYADNEPARAAIEGR